MDRTLLSTIMNTSVTIRRPDAREAARFQLNESMLVVVKGRKIVGQIMETSLYDRDGNFFEVDK